MKSKQVLFYVLLFFWTLAYCQYPKNTTLQQWTIKDVKYNDPKNGNPIIPGYYADPTIIEDNGTFYIYATSDLKSWNDINKMGVWSSTDDLRETWALDQRFTPRQDRASADAAYSRWLAAVERSKGWADL